MSEPAAGRKLLGQILKARGLVREAQIQEALAEQRKHGGLIGQHLVALKHCSSADVTTALAEQTGLVAVDLTRARPSQEALAKVDASTAHAYCVLPLELNGGRLKVAIADPLNTAVLEDLAFQTGLSIDGAVADQETIKAKVKEFYGEEGSIKDAIAAAASVAASDPEKAAQSAPVVRLLNSILHRAIADRASDVHFEVFPKELRVRYRVDGALYEIEAPPVHLAPALLARIKVMSDLDIAETKMPQDGRIALSIDGRP